MDKLISPSQDVDRTLPDADEETPGARLERDIEPLTAGHPGESGFYALAYGTDAFALRVTLIRNAEKTLDLQYYIWHDDLTGKVMNHQILEAADRGVRVRLLLDDLDTAGKEHTLHCMDMHPNIEIRLFNPFFNRKLRAIDYLFDFKRVNHRMHGKTFTVDGQATVFGGRNIGNEYFDASAEIGFNDLDALAVGPVVGEISGCFDLYWNSRWAYPLSALKTDLKIDARVFDVWRRKSEEFVEQARKSAYAEAIRGLELADITSISEIDFQWGNWELIHDRPEKVKTGPVENKTHMATKIKAIMDRAENELLIVSPYFVPGKEFTGHLINMVKRGVRVCVLTNSLAANDVGAVFAGYKKYREELIRGGITLYEFKPTAEAVKRSGITKKSSRRRRWSSSSRASLHGKYFTIDHKYIFIGSPNLDGRSISINTELGVLFQCSEYANLVKEGFDRRIMKTAYRLVLGGKGGIEWLTLENGKEIRYAKEPETGFWNRLGAGVLEMLVPERQL